MEDAPGMLRAQGAERGVLRELTTVLVVGTLPMLSLLRRSGNGAGGFHLRALAGLVAGIKTEKPA